MMYKFDYENIAFYLDNAPDGINTIDITEQEHANAFAGQSNGLQIAAGPDNKPMCVEPIIDLTIDLTISKRLERNRYLALTDPMVSVPDYTIADTLLTPTQITDLTNWRMILKTLPTDPSWPNLDIPAPELWLINVALQEGYAVPDHWLP